MFYSLSHLRLTEIHAPRLATGAPGHDRSFRHYTCESTKISWLAPYLQVEDIERAEPCGDSDFSVNFP